MSNNKTLVSLLFAVAIIAFFSNIFLPEVNVAEQSASAPLFMVAIFFIKFVGAIAVGVVIMLFFSERPWRKLRHSEDVIFANKHNSDVDKEGSFTHMFNAHSSK
jgi:hypothetical protein